MWVQILASACICADDIFLQGFNVPAVCRTEETPEPYPGPEPKPEPGEPDDDLPDDDWPWII